MTLVLDSDVFVPNVCIGAAHGWQQLSIIQGERSRVFGVQHQPAPAAPVLQMPAGQSGKERQCFQLFLFLILISSQMMMQATVMDVNSNRQGEERKQDAGNRQQEETTQNKDKVSVATWRIAKGRCCILTKIPNKKKTAREGATSERHSQGKDPKTERSG